MFSELASLTVLIAVTYNKQHGDFAHRLGWEGIRHKNATRRRSSKGGHGSVAKEKMNTIMMDA
jgi:hypothetical protein